MALIACSILARLLTSAADACTLNVGAADSFLIQQSTRDYSDNDNDQQALIGEIHGAPAVRVSRLMTPIAILWLGCGDGGEEE